MSDRLERSLRLLRESWAVLMQDRELLIFPICSGICSLLAAAMFAIPLVLLADVFPVGGGTRHVSHDWNSPLYYAGLFLFYLVTYFIVVFFNVGLVACAGIRLRGGDPTASDGFRFAFANLGRIMAWAAVAATVGTILRAIEERAAWLGQIVAGLLGLAWGIATAFVVPVLVFEQVGPFDAVKRSVAVLRKTWGEAIIGNAGLSLVFGVLAIAGVLFLALGFLAFPWGLVIGIALAILYWISLGIIQSALQGIFQTAVYEYATSGTVCSGFSADLIEQAYVPKRK